MYSVSARRDKALMAYEHEIVSGRFIAAARMARSEEMKGVLGQYECRDLELKAAVAAFDDTRLCDPSTAMRIAKEFELDRSKLTEAARRFTEIAMISVPALRRGRGAVAMDNQYENYLRRAKIVATHLKEIGLTQDEIEEVGRRVKDVIPMRLRASSSGIYGKDIDSTIDVVDSFVSQAMDCVFMVSGQRKSAEAQYSERMSIGYYSGAAYIAEALLESRELTEQAARKAIDDSARLSVRYALHIAQRFGIEDKVEELKESLRSGAGQ